MKSPEQTRAGLSVTVVSLLATALFISYFDRGILATASTLIQGEFALSKTQLGFLFAAFYWSYAPLQPIAGWLAQRFDVRYVLAGGLFLWALSTTLTGLATSLTVMLGLRVLLGFGESVAYPCNAKFLGQRAAVHERGRANGIIAVGQALGPTAGTVLSGLVMARWGWRPAFIVFGVMSLAWLVPWLMATREGATAGATWGNQPVAYRVLLRERSLWGTSLGHFCGNYAYYFMLTWLPLLLVKEFGFTLKQMAVIGGCVYGIQAITAAAMGWWCDRLILSGASPNRVLKTAVIAGLVGVTAAMVVCAGAGAELSVASMMLAGVGIGMQSSPMNSITQTLGGARTAGQWMGVQNLVANMAGVIAPPLTGFLVDTTGSYFWAFLVAASVSLLGVLAYAVVIQRVEPVIWSGSIAQ
jgi:MFS family permease